eukprot:CAMPEP_0197025552 /NCGR_PEP_ID=MMETSP1384-20130603/5841_1 /TAXON_ID=29189 /ORGANISM="Ammonia sp." /LENGTH=641 /DNA_ID=CAMNT_0042454091 /DNA_START=74 /DNA_END=1999 /DNA_ORIENTATION=+
MVAMITVSALLSLATAQLNIPTCTSDTECTDLNLAAGTPFSSSCTSGVCVLDTCSATNPCPNSGTCDEDSGFCIPSCSSSPAVCSTIHVSLTCNSATGACEQTSCTAAADCPDANTYLCGGGTCVPKCTVVDWCGSDEYCVDSVGYCEQLTCDMVPDELSSEFCVNTTNSSVARYCNIDDNGDAYCGPQPCDTEAPDCLTGEICSNSTDSVGECLPDCNEQDSFYCEEMYGTAAAVCQSSGMCVILPCTDTSDCAVLGDEFVCDLDMSQCAVGCFGNDTLCWDMYDTYSTELVCSSTDLCVRETCSVSADCTDTSLVCFDGECITPCDDDSVCEDRFGDLDTCNTDTGLCTVSCDPAVNSGVDGCTAVSELVGFELYCDTVDEMDCAPVSCDADADCTLANAECYMLPEISLCTVPCTDDAECNTRAAVYGGREQFCGVTGVCMPAEEPCESQDDCGDFRLCNEAGFCEMVLCHGDNPDAACQAAFANDFAACSDPDAAYSNGTYICLNNECMQDTDCTGKYNACADFIPGATSCFTTCTEDADCAAAYGIDAITCETLEVDEFGPGMPAETVMFCDIFNQTNSSYTGTLNPTMAPTPEPTEMIETTELVGETEETPDPDSAARCAVFVALTFVAVMNAWM